MSFGYSVKTPMNIKKILFTAIIFSFSTDTYGQNLPSLPSDSPNIFDNKQVGENLNNNKSDKNNNWWSNILNTFFLNKKIQNKSKKIILAEKKNTEKYITEDNYITEKTDNISSFIDSKNFLTPQDMSSLENDSIDSSNYNDFTQIKEGFNSTIAKSTEFNNDNSLTSNSSGRENDLELSNQQETDLENSKNSAFKEEFSDKQPEVNHELEVNSNDIDSSDKEIQEKDIASVKEDDNNLNRVVNQEAVDILEEFAKDIVNIDNGYEESKIDAKTSVQTGDNNLKTNQVKPKQDIHLEESNLKDTIHHSNNSTHDKIKESDKPTQDVQQHHSLSDNVQSRIEVKEDEVKGQQNNIQKKQKALSKKVQNKIDSLKLNSVNNETLQLKKDKTRISKLIETFKTNSKGIKLPQIDLEQLTDKYQDHKILGKISDLKQIKFIDNESKVLIMPSDDIVLGKLTKRAKYDLLDCNKYCQTFLCFIDKMIARSKRQLINKYLRNYDIKYNLENYQF